MSPTRIDALQVVVPIEMASWQHDAVAAKAAELCIELDVLIMRVVESAIVLDHLYEAVTDALRTHNHPAQLVAALKSLVASGLETLACVPS